MRQAEKALATAKEMYLEPDDQDSLGQLGEDIEEEWTSLRQREREFDGDVYEDDVGY